MDRDYRVGFAVGGAVPDPVARAGLPFMNRLQPLLPETRRTYGWIDSSMHRPIVMFEMLARASICHHLQSLHKPHFDSATAVLQNPSLFSVNGGSPDGQPTQRGLPSRPRHTTVVPARAAIVCAMTARR